MMKHPLFILAPLALLTACGDSEPVEGETNEQGGKVSGEILGGSISDEMIPLEELTSVSPPAAPLPSANTGGGSQEASGEAEPDSEGAEAAPPAAPAPPAVTAPVED